MRKLRQNWTCARLQKSNHNPNAFFLTGATWYYFAIYIAFTYFAPFTGYEDGILKVLSDFHVQRLNLAKNQEI